MSSPDDQDASPSPDYSGPEGSENGDFNMTAEQKSERPSGEHSPQTKPNGTTKSNTKDPQRPRRKKARRACFACQRAHLTCGDERPCVRCIKRGLQDHCMDGVRKKAKYLHDAPDGALMPGVGGHYPHMNGNQPVPVPTHSQEAVAQQTSYFTQAPSATYYPQNATPGQAIPVQDPSYNNQQPPISPQYGRNPQGAPVTQGAPSQMQQFGGPLFDPSDPALFNFDISSLNFGNHYGALELGMLGHMSSAAIDAPANDNVMNQAAHAYNGAIGSAPYTDPHGLPAHVSYGQDGLPSAEWQNPHSRHGSLQVHTPNNTPVTIDRHDSINHPMAYAIGQGGPSSLSSASPASMDFNAGYDNENPMSAATFFANANQSQSRGSPTAHRPQQESRPPPGPLYEMHPNAGRKRQSRDIYEGVKKPYDYPAAHHRMVAVCNRRFSDKSKESVRNSLGRFRPSLLTNASHLDIDDLVHAEKNLQRSLIAMQDCFAEVGTPSLIVRRTGEVVGMTKEFEILTGWSKEVLLGRQPNLNANFGTSQQRSHGSGNSSQSNTTPTLPGQEPESRNLSVNIVELLDEPSAVQYLSDFADFATGDPLGRGHRRVHFLRYQTKEDIAREAERLRGANGRKVKHEPLVKQEDGLAIHRGEAMKSLGSHNGLIDCMIMWHIKRDNFDMPMLVAFQIMPVLSTTQ
ncbi:transcription activator of gluconeogenesis [Bimuria novae-zelandiae CBS 107.79]|uniref:Transcription activator of gluconeogenesis n=1 Tax=Bimuria novae-zelandiae CBS 107.79 TaxID=1447943 RepID=A0A6A5V8L7_9PLEO|nr:transcription activator of gluconeogenesis [Bimuria novae-zelandiae CBS 107.79]